MKLKEPKVGEHRLIPANTKFWSIKNQTSLISDEDQIVEINNTCYLNDLIFVKPMQLLFNIPGYIPTLITKGVDEWELMYSETKPYKVPKPQFITYTNKNHE